MAEAFTRRGLTVLRCDLPFRQARATGPPRPADGVRDRGGLKDAATVLRRLAAGRLVLGGLSYGGRQASILAADEPEAADALLLLSYPLHPPHRPGDPRTSHFPRLRTPAFFVHGDRDPFGSIGELRRALGLVPAPTRMLVLEHAGHDLGRPRPETAQSIATAFGELIGDETRAVPTRSGKDSAAGGAGEVPGAPRRSGTSSCSCRDSANRGRA